MLTTAVARCLKCQLLLKGLKCQEQGCCSWTLELLDLNCAGYVKGAAAKEALAVSGGMGEAAEAV